LFTFLKIALNKYFRDFSDFFQIFKPSQTQPKPSRASQGNQGKVSVFLMYLHAPLMKQLNHP